MHLSRHYFPKLKKACKMGVSGAKEVKFTTFAGIKNLIELKLIDGVPANKAVGMPFLFKKYSEYFWQLCQKYSMKGFGYGYKKRQVFK